MSLTITVTLHGVDEAQARLQPSLVTEPLAAALDRVGAELATPKGSGLGVQVNTLAYSVSGMAAAVDTTLVWPRTQGTSWAAASEEDFAAMADQELAAAGDDIAAVWGA